MQFRRAKTLFLVCALGLCFLAVWVGSQVLPLQPLLTQCDDYTPPPCYVATAVQRDCCIYMGLPGYFRESWIVEIWRHPQAPRSVWFKRRYRVYATGERCTPMPRLTCRATQ